MKLSFWLFLYMLSYVMCALSFVGYFTSTMMWQRIVLVYLLFLSCSRIRKEWVEVKVVFHMLTIKRYLRRSLEKDVTITMMLEFEDND